MPKSLGSKDVPWCLLFLVTLSTTCHICVLLGNYETAKGLETIGQSTKGWSGIGLGLSHSLQHELDVVMTNMSASLLQAINHTMHTSQILNTVAAMAGMAADHMAGSDATKAITLLQEHEELVGSPLGVLPGLLTSSVDKLLDKLLKKALEAVDMLLKKIKPVLEDVGKFILKFGDKIQSVIEGFSVTLDHVQKLFDEVMASFSPHGTGEAEMRHETFNLFDVSGTGFVNKQDLKDCARLYDISAFRGKKADELVEKHDTDKDGRLNKKEFKLLVHDSSLPNAMSVTLRAYAKRLAEVAGNMAAAKQRDEVAQRVVNYLQLLCAKNPTKMSWVAGALANGSLPLEFTADVMAELALMADSPDVLTKVDVGAMVIGAMKEQHPQHTAKAYALLSNTTFWLAEGFHPTEHPICLKRVAGWMSASKQPAAWILMDLATVEVTPEAAFQLGEQNMKAHLDSIDELKEHAHSQLYHTQSSRHMLAHLLDGGLATGDSHSEGARIVKAGMPARPITILFAQQLANNASSTAKRFQQMCLNYSSKSSSTIDSFATQIQGMVKKVGGFIQMMERYSTPTGIKQLEAQIKNFAENAGKDVVKVVKKKFGTLVKDSAPAIDKAVNDGIDTVADKLGHSVGDFIGSPLGQTLSPVLQKIVQGMMGGGNASSKASRDIGTQLGKILGSEVSQLSGDMLAKTLVGLLHKMMNSMMSKAGGLVNSSMSHLPGLSLIEDDFAADVSRESIMTYLNEHATLHLAPGVPSTIVGAASLLQLRETADEEDADALSGVWSEVVGVLRSMSNVMPQATKTMKFARLEVSKLAANLDSLFAPFEEAGPRIFNSFGTNYRYIWTMYFCLLLPLSLALVVYGFWAGGFFGGPGKAEYEEEDDTPDRQRGIGWKLQNCCTACCAFCRTGHDMSLGFWSFIILLQLVVLLLFVVALIVLILSGIESFVAAGCQQVYILGDDMICGQTLGAVRQFLGTFKAEWIMSELPQMCQKENLLVCKQFGGELQSTALLTGICGFLAVLVSFQQLIESARLHTRAVIRRQIVKDENERDS